MQYALPPAENNKQEASYIYDVYDASVMRGNTTLDGTETNILRIKFDAGVLNVSRRELRKIGGPRRVKGSCRCPKIIRTKALIGVLFFSELSDI